MEGQTRGRSPSAGRQNDPTIRNSPSPHNFHAQASQSDFNPANQTLTQPYSTTSDISPGTTGNINFNVFNTNLDASVQHQSFQPSLDSFDQSFQTNGLDATAQVPFNAQQNPSFQADMFATYSQQPGFSKQELMIDPQLSAGGQLANQAVNPQDLMSNLSSPHTLAPTPPSFVRQHSEPSSPFAQSPHSQQQQQQSPHHSRNVSLDPSSAFSNGQQEWNGMMVGPQFTNHRRAPSEYSDVSSSNAPSPYIGQNEGFEHIDHNHSPLLNPQESQLYPDGLGLDTVKISDNQRTSPRHSPFVSPRMSPQAGLGPVEEMNFLGLQQKQETFGGPMQETYGVPMTESFPAVQPDHRLGSNDFGRADQFDVPQINVETAPSTHLHSLEDTRSPTNIDALSPPERGRRRGRAKSDTHLPRSSTPSSTAVNFGSPDSSISSRQGSLSPFDPGFSPHTSRPASPAARSSSARRSSTPSIPSRDYILELADPSRPPAPGTEKRVQKHPATFSCHLCPKKFTRAYNLRSHLRTHTDERPFVCTVCQKAFARQHDRKRHEGLHSGEKKFVCRGELGSGAQWGCGRRFARADALGRHFRSEAGRVCIKPLLDEEAIERQRMNDQYVAQSTGGLQPGINGMPIQQQFAFPAALLQQFPQLQGLSWETLGNGPDEDDLSGRSSFDASSGGDFDYDEEASGYMSDNPMGAGFQQQGMAWQDQGWKSDVEP